MDEGDTGFLEALSKACDVHRFDPSGQHGDRASSGYRDDGSGGFRQYRAWLDWRAARGRKQKKKGVLCSGSRTLKDIMETLGHHTVKADVWSIRVLQWPYGIYGNAASAEVRTFIILARWGAVILTQ